MFMLKRKVNSLLIFFVLIFYLTIPINISSATPVDPHDVTQIVYFPDSVLNGIIHNRLSIPVSDNVYRFQMAGLVSLAIQNTNITSFEGLQFATGLNFFNIENSTVTDTTYLKNLSIKQFTDYGTEFNNYNFLSTLSQLTNLQLNNLTNINFSVLSQLVNLNTLILDKDNISDLSFLNNLVNLNFLNLGHNSIASISLLNNNSSIKDFIIENNQIVDLTPISTMLNIEGVNAINNSVTIFPNLSNLSHLNRISVIGNAIDFSTGNNLTNLNLLKNKSVTVTYSTYGNPTPTPAPAVAPLSMSAAPMSTLALAPTTTPAPDLVTPSSLGIVNYSTVTKINDNTASVLIDDNTFSKAINLLQSGNSDTKSINVNVNQGNATNMSVEIPASSIINANLNAKGTTLNVISNNVSYELPLTLLDSISKNSKVFIKINGVDDTMKNSIANALSQKNATSSSKAYEFKITENENGINKEINNFGNVYVTRTLKLDKNFSNNLAFVYDPFTQDISYTPSVLTTVGDATYLKIKRNGNSIYGVAETSHQDFIDTKNHWAKDDIDYLHSKTIIDGKTDSKFAPNDKITRAEISKLIVKSLGLNNVQGNAKVFTDVNSLEWYANYIDIASSYGLINGYQDGTFKPNESLTREELSSIYSNVLGFLKKSVDVSSLNYSVIDKYKDVKALDDWAKIPTIQMTQLNILSGSPDQYFKPKESTTRAEVVVSLRRLLEYLKFIG